MSRSLLWLPLLLIGCNKEKDGFEIPTQETTAGATTATTTGGPTYPTAEFGLDERPANPTCVAPDRPLTGAQAELVRVYPGVSFNDPIWIGQIPGVVGWWYVVEQAGRIYRFDDDPAVSTAELVLDIRDRVNDSYNEGGLVGMAAHPDFANNGEIYLNYTSTGPVTEISRFTSSDGGATFDAGNETILASINQPFTNHNGGAMAFGPDGYLYLGMGDGGSGGDPGNRAQDVDDLLGKILRIDVDSGNPYGIPADNPFAAGGGRPEIYAWGIRNPWRMVFDPWNGDLWLGDVGQNDWEEVDKVELGGNYGWRIMEGNACYNPTNCSDAGLIRPHAVYPTSASSVVAGEVYYGSDLPELTGVLLYSDYYDGDIYGLFSDAITGLPAPALVANSNRTVVDFAAGADGEVYVADHGNGGIYRLERLGTTPVDPFPQTLTETGCFDASDATQPVEGMIPYTTSHAFWSDGAAKDRWFAIPDGTTITVGDDGDWELPIGSVTVKHFDLDGQRVETRLLVRHDDGEWAGYAYAWDAGGADATLLAGGLLVDTGGQEWSVPSRSDCMLCHTTAAGGSLGFETMQLNVEHDYPASGLRANQLATLDHIGMFTAALGDPDTLPVLPARGDVAASVEDQARAYLHTNCSQCHRPGGPGRGDLDMRWSTALADMNLCDVPPEHGDLDLGGSARVLAPGDPAASVISNRMHRRDAYQMPPLGSTEVDAEGAAWVDAWIASLSSCP